MMEDQTCTVQGCENLRRERVGNTGRFPTKCELHSPKADGTCKAKGCSKAPQWRRDGYCKAHWNEAHGVDPHYRRKSSPGDVFGELTLIAYSPRIEGRRDSFGMFRCSCGSEIERQLAPVRNGHIASCGDREKHPDPRHRGDEISYSTAHQGRLRSTRGPATEQLCAFCNEQAQDYAYLGVGGISEQIEKAGREKGFRYSTNEHDYIPLCRSCHTRMDRCWIPTKGEPIHAGREILSVLVNGPDHEREGVKMEERKILPRWDGLTQEELRECNGKLLCHVCKEPLPWEATSSTTTHEGDCRKRRDLYLRRKATAEYRKRKKSA